MHEQQLRHVRRCCRPFDDDDADADAALRSCEREKETERIRGESTQHMNNYSDAQRNPNFPTPSRLGVFEETRALAPE